MVVVWALALAIVLIVALGTPLALRFPVLYAGAAIMVPIAFFVQMLGGSSHGYINRVAASLTGAFAVFVVGGGAIAVISAVQG
ncbi:hypothetical protein D9V30_08310 [Mycetocola reblochoni]|uniref:Uncharacterized protein n=2 Tax=Mycetocola reblochoni TaxID=331618 RepID=A0A1R4JQY0_9MICO|nr:hypothetical protein D9V30_08310 [Mycetocola reblochoni]SJN34354.1 hypothetical protein FM119_08945 [Mycetocola reblochoni REB411]